MKWIPITEKLPALYEPVLFCRYIEEYGFGDVGFGWYEGMKPGWYEGMKTDGIANAIAMLTSDDWYPCTHWMPLPETPEAP